MSDDTQELEASHFLRHYVDYFGRHFLNGVEAPVFFNRVVSFCIFSGRIRYVEL